MPKYSRTAKYQDLRTALQSDSEADVKTNDLSPYEKRLKDIAPGPYSANDGPVPAEKEAAQGRRAAVYDDVSETPLVQPSKNPDYSDSYLSNNANYTSAFNNEYLNEYIREVKQYNIDQGNAISANTDLNILKALKGEKPKPPVKPYPDEAESTIRVPSGRYEGVSAVKPAPAKQPAKVQEIPAAAPVREADTADISFFNNRKTTPPVDFLDEEEENTMQEAPLSDTRTMSKEDIAAEVQRLINGAQQKKEKEYRKAAVRKRPPVDMYDTDEYDERTTRQQLLNETTQMRAQLDDYEDNLNDVNDKMKKTNQILNIVLVILIVALSLVLAVVIYWVLLSKGIIG